MTLTVPRLESHLVDRFAKPLPGAEAQWRFAPTPAFKGWAPNQRPATARRAAALVLLYPGHHGPALALTLRRDDLPQHPGQISFPGGALDPGEEPVDAALREAHEEVGVDPERVRIVGELSSLWVIVSNFVLHPFVGVLDARPDFRPAVREVASVVEAPLRDILDPAFHRHEQRMREGIDVRFPYFDIDGHKIWGATAMILGELVTLLDDLER